MAHSPAEPTFGADRNLLLGVHVLRENLINAGQFAAVCMTWAERPDQSLGALLVERGWLTPAARATVEDRLPRTASPSLSPGTVDYAPAPAMPSTGFDVDSAATTGPAAAAWDGEARAPIGARSRFTILRPHARGGLGQVSVARDEDLRRQVALKEIRPDRRDNPALRQRFLAEAEITGQLEHPGVVPVYALAHDAEGCPFYAMRFIEGQTLSAAIAAYHQAPAPLAFRELLQRFVSVSQTLAYAHSKGVVHRDLKPANVMLGDYGETLVVDWGLAKRREDRGPNADTGGLEADPASADSPSAGSSSLTQAGDILGTPAYMAPEQAQGDAARAGPAADVYALGAILYELLTGRAPYPGKSGEALERLRQGPPEPPAKVRTGVPPALAAVCARAMARAPADRYASAAELARDVERWLADEPVTAWVEPWTVRAGRWVRRHRASVLAAGVAVAVAAVCLGIASAMLLASYREVEHQRDLAGGRFRMARNAVDEYFTRVTQTRELRAYGLELLRERLLQGAVEFYQKLVLEEPDDAEVQAEQARAYQRLGQLSQDLGRHAEAEKAYGQAIEQFKRLADANPQEPGYQAGIARVVHDQAMLYSRTGRGKQAEQAFLREIEIERSLAAAAPMDPERQRTLSSAEGALATFYHGIGRNDLAEKTYLPARKIKQRLVDADPQNTALQHELARMHHNIGIFYYETARYGPAEMSLRRALAIDQRLHDGAPDVVGYQQDLAHGLNDLGNIYRALGDTARANQNHRRALAEWQRLTDTHPQVLDFQHSLAVGYYNLGAALFEAGRSDLAEPASMKALTLYQRLTAGHPEVLDYALDLGGLLGNLGEIASDRGHQTQALDHFTDAIRRLEEVLRKDRRKASALGSLLVYHGERAVVYARLGKPSAAALDLAQARKLAGGQDRVEIHFWQAFVAALDGDHARAAAEAAVVDRDPGLTGRNYYDQAAVYTLASVAAQKDGRLPPSQAKLQAERLAGRAVAMLRKALAAGFFRDPAVAARVGGEKDLETLRTRADFHKLLADLPRSRP